MDRTYKDPRCSGPCIHVFVGMAQSISCRMGYGVGELHIGHDR